MTRFASRVQPALVSFGWRVRLSSGARLRAVQGAGVARVLQDAGCAGAALVPTGEFSQAAIRSRSQSQVASGSGGEAVR